MRRILIIPIFMIIWAIVTLLAVSAGIQYDWPDYVHVDHGVPLVWATHTLSTFAGPADTWTVNLTNLAVDLAIWLAIMIVIVAALLLYKRDRKNAS